MIRFALYDTIADLYLQALTHMHGPPLQELSLSHDTRDDQAYFLLTVELIPLLDVLLMET